MDDARALLASWGLSRFLPRAPLIGRLVLAGGEPQTGAGVSEPVSLAGKRALVGARGRAVDRPATGGLVVLEGRGDERLEARSGGVAIDSGASVRVVEVQTGRFVVEAVDAPAPVRGEGEREAR